MTPPSDPSLPEHHDLLPPALRQRMRAFVVDEEEEPTQPTIDVPREEVAPVSPWAAEARTERGAARSTRALRGALQARVEPPPAPEAPAGFWAQIAARLRRR